MKKMAIGNKLYDVTTFSEYTDLPDAFDPKFTAIETSGGTTLPLKSKSDNGPGVYLCGNMVATVVKPDPSEESNYSSSNIIDYSHPKNIDDVINKNNLVRNIEKDILTTKENIFQLVIGDNDTREMVAMKKAINSKQMDIKQYESRFDQYQNDLRLLKGESITLGKIISTCNNFDMSATLIIKDKNPDVPNPMGIEIKVDLTDNDGGE